ncbi:hypothetical protein BKA65DRAFT_589457 [Rhexocercosporidium sp. MPI-PUGE-AT-0058]|nr:hypothetical protein BKA65DRAFT_589457 [Rhexocercosporidium sp. MPI-PUGE-AT-0058]
MATKHLLTNLDLKIYCDQSRLVRRVSDGKSYWFDKDIQQQLRDEDYSRCSFSATFMFVVTAVYPKRPLLEQPYMQIQICPFFLAYAVTTPNKWTVFLTADYWKKIGVTLVENLAVLIKYTPIDAYSLFDKVLLHELTHANRKFSTLDVAYGWKKCRDLSTVQTMAYGEPKSGFLSGDPAGPELNADSWALYGSIAWQISSNKITGIRADGSLILV